MICIISGTKRSRNRCAYRVKVSSTVATRAPVPIMDVPSVPWLLAKITTPKLTRSCRWRFQNLRPIFGKIHNENFFVHLHPIYAHRRVLLRIVPERREIEKNGTRVLTPRYFMFQRAKRRLIKISNKTLKITNIERSNIYIPPRSDIFPWRGPGWAPPRLHRVSVEPWTRQKILVLTTTPSPRRLFAP